MPISLHRQWRQRATVILTLITVFYWTCSNYFFFSAYYFQKPHISQVSLLPLSGYPTKLISWVQSTGDGYKAQQAKACVAPAHSCSVTTLSVLCQALSHMGIQQEKQISSDGLRLPSHCSRGQCWQKKLAVRKENHIRPSMFGDSTSKSS